MLLLLMVMLWSAPVPAQTTSDSIPPAARREIEAANKEWLPAMEARDAAAIAKPYADDGVFVAANGAVAKGRPAIEQLMRQRFESMGKVVRGVLVQDGLTRQGTLIYEWGHGTLEIAAADGATRSTGRYLTVWQASSDGHWRIVRNLSLPE
jgi:uncharacterized protein (TIGR02246 family)